MVTNSTVTQYHMQLLLNIKNNGNIVSDAIVMWYEIQLLFNIKCSVTW